jgi:hypothetical protein
MNKLFLAGVAGLALVSAAASAQAHNFPSQEGGTISQVSPPPADRGMTGAMFEGRAAYTNQTPAAQTNWDFVHGRDIR